MEVVQQPAGAYLEEQHLVASVDLNQHNQVVVYSVDKEVIHLHQQQQAYSVVQVLHQRQQVACLDKLLPQDLEDLLNKLKDKVCLVVLLLLNLFLEDNQQVVLETKLLESSILVDYSETKKHKRKMEMILMMDSSNNEKCR